MAYQLTLFVTRNPETQFAWRPSRKVRLHAAYQSRLIVDLTRRWWPVLLTIGVKLTSTPVLN